MDAQKVPVKNTFIHFDDATERPGKRSRASSAPPETRTEEKSGWLGSAWKKLVGTAAASEQPKKDAEQKTEEKKKEPEKAVKKAAVRWADVEPEEPEDSRSSRGIERAAKHSRSRSRSAHRLTKGEAPKELSVTERLEKRAGYVTAMKDTEGYKAYLEKREGKDEKAVKAPRTPDPDAACSKRAWEGQILAWRSSLREWGTVTVAGEKE